MDSARLSRWLVLSVLIGTLLGCGQMLPMGGREELVKYTVSKGETLYSISWRYGYDYREVAAWNSISPPYNIYPGQQLYLIAPYQRYPKDAPTSPTAISGPSSATSKQQSTAAVVSRPAVVAPSTTVKPLSRKKSSSRVEKHPVRRKQGSIAWRWPSEGVVVSGFTPSKGKKGLDIRGKLGQSILAAADGNVVYSGSGLIGYGNLVIIKHNDTYLSAYGHNRRLLVKEGAAVKQGQKIAEMGDSGKEGVILHFEIRRDGKPVNPLTYLPKR